MDIVKLMVIEHIFLNSTPQGEYSLYCWLVESMKNDIRLNYFKENVIKDLDFNVIKDFLSIHIKNSQPDTLNNNNPFDSFNMRVAKSILINEHISNDCCLLMVDNIKANFS